MLGTRAGSLELEGRETKQLGSPSREGGIDKAIGKGPQVLSLWEATPVECEEKTSLQGRCSVSPRQVGHHRGIQYLCYDPDNAQSPTDPEEFQCM